MILVDNNGNLLRLLLTNYYCYCFWDWDWGLYFYILFFWSVIHFGLRMMCISGEFLAFLNRNNLFVCILNYLNLFCLLNF